ncbi:aminopeptidase N [Erythrobacter sp. W53]|uniref:aminopeptidase N n=1 Tax=Erythrobacter sp. W53 TaxID=3425947 RepID=UPI003D76862E
MENLSNTPTAQPPVIYRKDYQPFPWLLPETELVFNLGLETTLVLATFTVTRNPDAEASQQLRLNGDGLTPARVTVDDVTIENPEMDGDDLVLTLSGDSHKIMIETELDPSSNTQLMGLYASNGMLCTQCEAEGFRRITFFPDRPDVLSTYWVHMSGPKDLFPVLLCNGNKVKEGDSVGGHHFAEWHDPWPKPSYLFALVAGDLVAREDTFTTMGGREVDLAVWVRAEDLDRTEHAMASLIRSMKWDEETFGREYDLDVYNIVAVSDFNMGAMENKGLNVFNTKYVLADSDTATDADFDAVEGVIAHEYFHNWSGNRVTCRDWFQLSLKEGFTVLRDQLFSQDMHSESVKRIEDVRILRSAQFPEDSGPLAHPIRPDSFREISNFYTATVYNKGAEVIRMMRSMAGPEKFRKGTDLYFDRHDGEAATCEDFISAIEDGAELDLTQFRGWYRQAGTPRVAAELVQTGGTTELRLTQSVPDTPGQSDKAPMPIPLKIALHDRAAGKLGEEQLIVLSEAEMRVPLGEAAEPVLSINRGFTAPVVIERDIASADLAFLAAHDDDPFARYEAMQELVVGHLLGAENAGSAQDITEAMGAIIADGSLDDSMRGELMALPGVTYLMEQVEKADPTALHEAREGLKKTLGVGLRSELAQLYDRAAAIGLDDPQGRGARKVKTMALGLLAAGDPGAANLLAAHQYDHADNMTDRQGALMTLCGFDTPERVDRLADFYERYRANDLVIDKWFTLQALSTLPGVLDHVRELAKHADFTLSNPNRARSLYMALASNPAAFHTPSGEGYRMIADLILALDPINAQTAARFVPALGRWRRMEEGRAALMRAELERIAKAEGLSRDTSEQVTRSLG